MRLICSCCGRSDTIKPLGWNVSDLLDKGWRSYSSNPYCPECSKTWHERNDKPLGNRGDTYALLHELAAKERKRNG